MDAALDEWREELGAEELKVIEQARTRVVSALENNSSVELKRAVESLDAATEILAARLVERALAEQLLRKLGEN